MGKQFIQKDFNNMKSSTWSEIIKHNELHNDSIISALNYNSNMVHIDKTSDNFTNCCCSIRPNAVSVSELENLTKNVDKLELELNKKIETMNEKMNKEINEKLNWQTICLYLTWAMLIVLGFMICFKSFDISVEVNNPIQNQEVILKHE